MKSERIITVWRFGYFKLFNDAGEVENEEYVSTEEYDWKQLFWRFYWREG